MRKIFEQFGSVVWAVIAVVALIGVIFLFFMGNGNGWIEGSFKDTIDAFGDKAGVAIEGQPRLDTPDISIVDKTLTITPVENATSYEVYNGDELLLTTTETTVELGTYLTEFGAYTVRVRALADGYKPSGYDEEAYVLELEPGLYQTGTNYTVLKYSWDELIDKGYITVAENAITAINSAALAGDLMVAEGVTDIGQWFSYGDLTGIILPETVTSVGSKAFAYASSITHIQIPNTVTTIGEGAFINCANLTSVTFGENSQLTNIDKEAFKGCAITSIDIPDKVTSIGASAFGGCKNLTSVMIPDGVTSIGASAFGTCTSLTSVTIPDSVTSIGKNAFGYCTSMAAITVGSGNTVYHSTGNCLIETASKTLVAGCKNSVIPTDGTVTSIGDGAFKGSGLIDITIPDSVTRIGADAFANCKNLSSVTFGENSQLTSIGDYAFQQCENLTSIDIPGSVTSIGSNVFSRCTSLVAFTVGSGNTVYHSAGNCLIKTASKTLVSGCKNSVIPTDGTVTSIGDYAFHSRTNLTSIAIPDSVTSIGHYAFYGCTNLNSITFEGTVEQWDAITLGSNLFRDVPATEVQCSDGTVSLS